MMLGGVKKKVESQPSCEILALRALSFCSGCAILCTVMNEPETISIEAVLIYMDGARNALRGARHDLDGDFFGVAVNRAYYAFFTLLRLCC